MNPEEHDDLWHLLGRAKNAATSPFFSRNVLRAIREEVQEQAGAFAWLRRHWQLTTVSACAIMIAGFVVTPPTAKPDQITMLFAEKVSQSPDYQVISHLDELLASEESFVWLEN